MWDDRYGDVVDISWTFSSQGRPIAVVKQYDQLSWNEIDARWPVDRSQEEVVSGTVNNDGDLLQGTKFSTGNACIRNTILDEDGSPAYLWPIATLDPEIRDQEGLRLI